MTTSAVSHSLLSDLTPNPLNPRGPIDPASVQELADSIKSQGVLQPLLITTTGVVVAGHRRLQAARLAGLQELPVLARDFSESEQLQIMLVENIQREDLSPLQEARAYRQLIDTGMTQSDVARQVGVPSNRVQSRLVILKLCPEVQEMYGRDVLSTSIADTLARVTDPRQQQRFANIAARRQVPTPQLEKLKRSLGELEEIAEEWAALEDWYLREGAGLLSRKELASDLNRTPDAVHRRLYDLGLHSYQVRWGWTLHHVGRVVGVPRHLMDKYLERGEVAFLRGSKCIYVDPADLLHVDEIDWQEPHPELERDVRRALMGRLVNVLSGKDARTGSLFEKHRKNQTTRVWVPRLVKPTPRPNDIAVGDRVRCEVLVPGKEAALGREGVVHTVYWRANKGLGGQTWVARVEFKKERHAVGRGDRVKYTLPLAALQRPQPEVRRWHFTAGRFQEVS